MNAAVRDQIEAARAATVLPRNWRNDGKEFEREFELTAAAYQVRRTATLKKVDPPVRVFSKPDASSPSGRRQVVVFLPNPHLDYVGAWTVRNARALFVELKSTAKPRLPFNGAAGGGMKPEQWTAMKTWRHTGAACCLLWRCGDEARLWTPDMLAVFDARGDKSVKFETGLPVSRGVGNVVWDFLPVLERAIWPAT